jgi:hypothetical protein
VLQDLESCFVVISLVDGVLLKLIAAGFLLAHRSLL